MPETSIQVETIQTRLEEVRRRIEASARRAGRAPEEVTLIAVSKTHPAPVLAQAIASGVRDLGENRVQEAEGKIETLRRGGDDVRWHLIGHLQKNKARRAVSLFDVVHSVDSGALVERLERLCVEAGRDRLDALVQVDLGGEATKDGAPENQLEAIVAAFKSCERVRLKGLMTLPPFFEDAEQTRPFFRRLRSLRDALGARGAFGEATGELSMGMSHDYETAIEEGATMVRVGTAIFGTRTVAA